MSTIEEAVKSIWVAKIATSLVKLRKVRLPLYVLAVGTPTISGDAIGPFAGTLIKQRAKWIPVTGTLAEPLTAQHLAKWARWNKWYHNKKYQVIAIDAGYDPLSKGVFVSPTPLITHTFKLGDIAVVAIPENRELHAVPLEEAFNLADVIAQAIIKCERELKWGDDTEDEDETDEGGF